MATPRRYRVRPNPVGSFFGGIVGIAILFIGGGAALEHIGSEAGPFLVLWILVVCVAIGANFYNAFSDRGIASNVVEVEEDGKPDIAPPVPAPLTPAARLDQLADLRMKNLITAAEYDERRAVILRQL